MSKHVLITGASRGIGAAAARAFGQAGWSVSLNYNRGRDEALALAEELTAMGVRAQALGGDVSDQEQAGDLVERAQELAPLDCLVCCAGIALPQQLLTDTTLEQWRQVMGVDLDGVFHVIRAVIPGMGRRQAGSIVTVSSMWGVTGGSCEAPYSAAKAGLRGLTMALCKELGPSGITVNCIEPGVIDTEMNGALDEETRRELAEATPLCRIGTPREVAEAVLFLASDAASFITGQCLGVDGGFAV